MHHEAAEAALTRCGDICNAMPDGEFRAPGTGRFSGGVLPQPATPYDSHRIGTARLLLDDWKFASAQARGHAVADYLIVRVPLGPAG